MGDPMRMLHLAGTPASMGEAFGESCRGEIAELYALRLAGALADAREFGAPGASEEALLDVARRSLPIVEAFDPQGAAELRGIARGAGLGADAVLAMNGLTDFRDALVWAPRGEAGEGCTACIVQRDASRDGRLWLAQTWDLATENQPYVLAVRRQPREGPETISVTTVGCLSLLGWSEAGLVIGTTNLRTRDARPGVPYLSVIHRALGCRDADAAARCIGEAPRAGGHSYMVADRAGRAFVVECAATRAHVLPVDAGFRVHCNHCLWPEIAELEVDAPRASSRERQRRLEALLGEAEGAVDAAALRRFMGDRAGGTLAICRRDFDGISSNAAWVVTPDVPVLSACWGPPGPDGWVDLLAGARPLADQPAAGSGAP